jgi:4-hydroxybenzoate polyprenyltransferase
MMYWKRASAILIIAPMASLFESFRLRQWPKNFVLFAAVVFSGELLIPSQAWAAVSAFTVFCLLSSAIYIINDIIDRRVDRIHPIKRLRPIASGAVSLQTGLAAASILFLAGFTWALRLDRKFAAIAAAYVVLMTAYALALKHVVIADVLAISVGFVLRAWAGAAVVHVRASPWLLTLTLLLATFLSLSKRRDELVYLGGDAGRHRRSLQAYSLASLDRMIALIALTTLGLYVVYAANPHTVARFDRRALLTIPFPLFGIVRYLYLTYRRGAGNDPSEQLLSDRPLLACVGLWAAVSVAAIYYF